MEVTAAVTPTQNKDPDKAKVGIPIIPVIPTKENYAKAKKRDLIIIAVKTYQHQTFKDDAGEVKDVLTSEERISDKIYEMTDNTVRISQSWISKIIKMLNSRKINLHGKLYTIDKVGGTYMLTEDNNLTKQAPDVISPSDIFFNNPTGVSTVFAIKSTSNNLELIRAWLEQIIGHNLFKMFTEDNTVIALLRVDTATYRSTSIQLKNALLGDGLKNTNYALRNFAKSWK